MRTNPSRSPPKLNSISKNKRSHQSDFRVHFILMNVKWRVKQKEKEKLLVDNIYSTVNPMCTVHVVQISEPIDDDTFDVSIGLAGDLDAFHFLKTTKTFTIWDGVKANETVVPVISRAFQCYMATMEKQIPQSQPQQIKPIQKSQSETSKPQIPSPQLKQVVSQDKKQKMEAEVSEQKQRVVTVRQRYNQLRKSKDVSKILCFGIPKQFTVTQVKQALKNKGIESGECRWKHKQHMQYLQIQLLSPISRMSIYTIDLQIEGYPVVVIPGVTQHQIMKQLSKYTVQIITKPTNHQQQKLIKIMRDIGGINLMIRTPIKDKQDFRYVIVFSNVDKAEKACKMVKNVQDCQVYRKQYELKVGRINKFFTFQALVFDQWATK